MYSSRFLLNRQKIINPPEIHKAIASYFSELPTDAKNEFFYRLEWYKIGISVPFTVYSTNSPVVRLMPECQLLETNELADLADNKYYDFAIFAAPPFDDDWDPVKDKKRIIDWLTTELKSAGKIMNHCLGPNNRIYYESDGEQLQLQTVTINGTLEVKDLGQLEKLRQNPLGRHPELGCGLLELTARSEYAGKVCCRL
ncbi:MAG: hypothetical protein CVV42_15800 [Candidatus Riflebacteria bacterium HGW-Riflebacteria-2]|jgi:hypothetical protein|nr:MAG: hypothetical protein CVV42_15800 [Candidatus Riflebacteria bacterium HGW-Riflebacteria-2]